MSQAILIYGHGDKSDKGFKNEKAFRRYIKRGVFQDNQSRYRYSQRKQADLIVLSRDGLAHGHFNIESLEDPNEQDRMEYPPVQGVYTISSSALYKHPVRLADLGLTGFQYGLPISEKQLGQILQIAGTVTEHRTLSNTIQNKYCRICWNTNGWRKPSGAAEETGSFVAMYGFGHEEWLFNYEWCIDGYKYAFLQPIHKHRDTYEGQRFAVALYTKCDGRTLLAALIREVYVPTRIELQATLETMTNQGWLKQMREDVSAVEGNLSVLENPIPEVVLNIRFRPSDVTLFDPMPLFADGHVTMRAPRYQALNWKGEELPATYQSLPGKVPHSELERLRAAQQATTVDPKHVRLQNRLYKSLCECHGADAVFYEENWVDLKVRLLEGDTFFEIKTDSSAKKCIRNAIGQLLEYATYPLAERAIRWVIVGDAPITGDDLSYLEHLRSKFSMPVHYAQFDWENGDIGPLI